MDPSAKQVAVREWFLASVQAAYAEQMSKGILRQDGPQAMLLQSSVEWAYDHIKDGLQDIDYVVLSIPKPQHLASRCWRKTLSILTAALTLHEHYAIVAKHDRTCVYVLTCYIQAHCEAQEAAEKFLDNEGLASREKEQVISDSKANVSRAKNELAKISANKPGLEADVKVQQTACVVLESERRYVDELASGGVLDDGQAHELYHHIEADIAKVRRGEKDMLEARENLWTGSVMMTEASIAAPEATVSHT